jgi:HEAT repeat protein
MVNNNQMNMLPLIDRLISELSSDDRKVREKARLSLILISEPAILSLVKALDSKNNYLRWQAVKTLALMRNPDTIPFLVGALVHRDIDVRWLAAEGLIALGSKSVMPLLKALTSDPYSTWLHEGTHHILHDLYHGRVHEGEAEYYMLDLLDAETRELLKPVLKSIEGVEPHIAVPLAAKEALDKLTAREVGL